MRVNVYQEELTDRIEIDDTKIESMGRIGVNFYLYLPVTTPSGQTRGPFNHTGSDDDSAAVTFWGSKQELIELLRKAVTTLEAYREPS